MLKNTCSTYLQRIRYFSKLLSEHKVKKLMSTGCTLPHEICVQSGRFTSPSIRRCLKTTSYLEKSKKNRSKREIYSDNDDDDDDDDDDEDDESKAEFKDEYNSKVIKAKVNSLRTDAIIKSGLGISRNKVEEIFYDSRIRVNGRKLPKKSVQLNEGDEVDVIQNFSPNSTTHLIVNRVVLLAATANKDSIQVHLRRYKNMLIENYSGVNVYKTYPIIDEDKLD